MVPQEQTSSLVPYDWSRLDDTKLGRYANVLVYAELVRLSFEVDTTKPDVPCFSVLGSTNKRLEVRIRAKREGDDLVIQKNGGNDHLLITVFFANTKRPKIYAVPIKDREIWNDFLKQAGSLFENPVPQRFDFYQLIDEWRRER